MAKREIETCSYIVLDGEPVEFCTLPPEKRRELWDKMMANASRVMSDYYSLHPEELPDQKKLPLSG